VNENQRIAARLREAAERLEEQGDNAFRVAAFRRAADTIEQWPRALREIYDRHGPSGLQELPGVGAGIGGAIAEMLITGRWKRLERLRNPSRAPHGPERVLTYFDDEGIEQDCVVVMKDPSTREPTGRSRSPGRG
jgi:DNA polymerase/3'-5' exonuclease PolX